jgi:hypothetical protein
MKHFITTDDTIDVKKVRKDPLVNTRGSSGVDAWCLYGEIDVRPIAGDPVNATLRFLAAGNALFYQLKWADRRAAGWNFSTVPTTDALSQTLQDALPKRTINTLRGAPIVGQLVATDVESITHKNEAPQGRYTFKATYEKHYGKGV